MKSGILVLCWLIIGGCAFAQIRIENPIRDLGDVFESGGEVTVKFTLTNPYSSDTIRITDIATSCGCTAVLTRDTLILPKSSIQLDVVYDPKGRLGLFVKSVALTTKTGNNEYNKLYLKIMGNVVGENFIAQEQKTELKNYEVAPIYTYPITPYDTAYLDFNFFKTFVNDLTYEIDYYQFTTVGFELEVPNFEEIEQLEQTLNASIDKLNREFNKRGFSTDLIFYNEPVFKLNENLPIWASARMKIFSVNFDAPALDSSIIEVATETAVKETKMLLDYQRFAMPTVEEVLEVVNFESIEGKLFLAGNISLKGTILVPWKKSGKSREKLAYDLEKAIFKKIKETTGASKKEVTIQFDSLGIHPKDKFQFYLWDVADQEAKSSIKYRVKADKITPPLLPTYHQEMANTIILDTQSVSFKRLWQNLLLNQKIHQDTAQILMVYSIPSISNKARNEREVAHQRIMELKEMLMNRFEKESENGVLTIQTKIYQTGPKLGMQTKGYQPEKEYALTLIPLMHLNPTNKTLKRDPYQVNFDFFFNGINTQTWSFSKFSDMIAAEVNQHGYIILRIESSISQVPVEENISNLVVAYNRLNESVRRLKEAMSKKLVDPNRIVIADESAIIQGPIYDGKVPVLAYRPYHYLKIIPDKYLNHEK